MEGYISTSALALRRGCTLQITYMWLCSLLQNTSVSQLPPENNSWSTLFPGPAGPLSAKVQDSLQINKSMCYRKCWGPSPMLFWSCLFH